MDSKKILEKYLKPSAAIKIIGLILIVASLAMLVMGIISASAATGAVGKPEEFDSLNNEKGEYVYLDVVGISDWAYKVDGKTYYVALDKWDYVYIVQLSNSEFKKMDDQNEYFTEDDVPMPKSYTLKGVARKLSTDDRNEIADCFDIPSYESKDYFGTMYLDATSTPGDDAFAMWLVGFIVCFVLGLIFLLITLPASGNFKKCMALLEERGLVDMAAAELESGEYEQVGKDCARLTRQFFFGKNSGMVLPYGDIQWLYRQNVKRNFVTVNVNLIVSTNKLNQKVMMSYNGRNRDEELNKVFMTVAERNPNVLLGYSSENRKAYKERKEAAKLG
jgi:hypothetical protein